MTKKLFLLLAIIFSAAVINAQDNSNKQDSDFRVVHRPGNFEESNLFDERRQIEYEKIMLEMELASSGARRHSLVNSFQVPYQPSSKDRANLRTAGETPDKLLSGITHQAYNVEAGEFENKKLTKYVYESDSVWHKYTLKYDETGNLGDTVLAEYEKYGSGNEDLLLRETYQNVNGEMKLIGKWSGYREIVEESKCKGRVIKSQWDYRFDAIYLEVPEQANVLYLSSQSLMEIIGDTTIYTSYNFFPNGDTSYFYISKTHSDLGQFFNISLQYDEQGKVTYGWRYTDVYNEQGKATLKKNERWNTSSESWFVSSYEKHIYNELGRLIEDETGTDIPGVKFEYVWANDTISTFYKSFWNNADRVWNQSYKYEYIYKTDTTIMKTYRRNDLDWVQESLDWYLYFTDDAGNQVEVHSTGEFNQVVYPFLDSLINNVSPNKERISKQYFWNGFSYQLSKYSIRKLKDPCQVVLNESVGEDLKTKIENRYGHPYDLSDATGSTYYKTNDTDISDGVDWTLDFRFDMYYYDDGERGLWKGAEFYSVNSGSGFRHMFERNEDHQFTKYTEHSTQDLNPEDGFDWWLRLERNYVFNDDKTLKEVVTTGRENENDTMTYQLRDLYQYTSGDFEIYCDIIFIGDTLISGTKAAITASMVNNGGNYTWFDGNKKVLSETAQMEFDSAGWYYVKAVNEACINTDSIKIWKMCDITIIGDSILTDGKAKFSAELDEEVVTSYGWYDETGELLGTGAVLEVSNPGIYVAKASGEYCYGIESWNISEITGIGDETSINSFNLYPNPAQDQIFILLKEPTVDQADLAIYDLNGKILFSYTLSEGLKETKVNLQGIKPGFYILKFESSNYKSYTRKFVVN